MVKKGYFFSMDALIAVVLILLVLIIIPTFYIGKKQTTQQVYIANDILEVLSTLRTGEINDPNILSIINDSSASAKNRTIIEQILRLQVDGYTDRARRLAEALLGNLTPNQYGIGIWAEGYDDAIYSTSNVTVNQLITYKQIISGIEKERSLEGSSSRVFLTGIDERFSSNYVYFGGYVGDGNISQNFVLPEDINITSAYMELDINDDFNFYINDLFIDHFSPTYINSSVDSWTLVNNLSLFHPGNNTIGIRFNKSGGNKYIGGGYFKVSYSTKELSFTQKNYEKDTLPGISGIINLYSSFFVPGILDTMNIHLHYKSDFDVFLNIGDTTVYEYKISGENRITINDTALKNKLNYSELSKKTIPLRLGIKNISYYLTGFGGTADSVLVTDVSGSMDDCGEYNSTLMCDYDCCVGGSCPDSYSCESDTCADEECGVCGSYPQSCLYDCYWFFFYSNTLSCASATCAGIECGDCGGFGWSEQNHQSFGGQSTAQNHNSWFSTQCIKSKLEIAKVAGKEFIDVVLQVQDNKVGLVSYEDSTSSTHDLSDDNTSLYAEIDSYVADGATCICCGINSAADMIVAQSNTSRTKSMLVMSDGQANQGCARQPNSTSTADAVQAACDAYNDYNITVYTVGFGSDADLSTLNAMAECGRGSYYNTNITNLTTIYTLIGQEIANLSYRAQTITFSEETGFNNTLYEDSYIEFNYTPTSTTEVYGLIPLTVESEKFGNTITEGSFDVPLNTEIFDAKLVSYSGDRWTDMASIKNNSEWISFYNLSEYSTNYFDLGDPYMIDIPVELIQKGTNNTVRVSTALTQVNTTGGSTDNKAIYTLGISLYSNYTGVYEKAQGCEWTLFFEDDSNATIKLPPEYNGTSTCQFDNSSLCQADYTIDAINNAACNLFDQLDFDNDGKLFVKIGQDTIQTEIVSIGGIPYMWGPTVIEVRVWN